MKNAFTQKPDMTKWVNDQKISERSKHNGAFGAAALNMKNGGKNEAKVEITMVLGKSKTGKKGVYECATVCGIEFLFWDGSKFWKGITKWRGLTKKEHVIRCLPVSY